MEQPAIVWLVWLVFSFGGYQQLVLVRGAGWWSQSSLYFLVMMLIVALMARKREQRGPVLWTAGIVLSTVALILML